MLVVNFLESEGEYVKWGLRLLFEELYHFLHLFLKLAIASIEQ